MKRFAAILLTGCLVLQSLPCSVLAAQESEIPTEAETVLAVEDPAVSNMSDPVTAETAAAPETENTETAAEDPGAEVPGEETSAQPEQEIQTAPATEAPSEEAIPEESGSEEPGLDESGSDELPSEESGSNEFTSEESGSNELTSEESGSNELTSEESGSSELTSEEPGLEEPGSEELSSEELSSEELTSEELTSEELTSEMMSEEEELILDDAMETETETEGETETELDLDALGVMMISADNWADKSFLEVKVVSTLPYLISRDVTISLDGPQPVHPRVITVPSETSVSGSTKFTVEPGEYTVRIHAPKFADYVQTVKVEPKTTAKIEVCMSRTEKISENSGTRGWMRLGDITGDGKILSEFGPEGAKPEDRQQDDVRVMLDAIRGNATYTGYNLNETVDGVVDLADLQIVVQSLTAAEQIATVSMQSVPQSLEPVGDTVVTDVEKLMNDEGSARLATKSDAVISEENPVAVEFLFNKKPLEGEEEDNSSLPVMEGMTIQAPKTDADGKVEAGVNNIASGEVDVVYVDETGTEQTMAIPINGPGAEAAAAVIAAEGIMTIAGPVQGNVSVESDGSMVLNFGGKIAVKRVTIKITGTRMNQNLVDIAKVEFVNDMESRIPAPVLSIPAITRVETGNKELVVYWEDQTNVTGYEVSVTGPTKNSNGADVQQIVRVSGSPHTIVSINDDDLVNFKNYSLKVRSINGEWASDWYEWPELVQPQPKAVPDKVDNLVTTGGFRSIRATWKDMDDADGYMLYYKEESESEFRPVADGFTQTADGAGRLTSNSCTLEGLKDGTVYELYVVGWNSIGWGQASLTSVAETESGETPQLPKFRLINTSNGVGVLSAHITGAYCGDHGGQKMVNSALDEARTGNPEISGAVRKDAQWAFGVADDDYVSYWIKNDWDDGVSYPVNDFSKGITVTFDAEYKMNYLTFTATDIVASPERASIVYWNQETGAAGASLGCSLIREIDATNRPYFIVKFDKAVTASQIQMYLGTGYNKIDLKVAEMHFHHYDGLDEKISALFADEMHSTLAEGVTQEQINALRALLYTPDPETNELHPLYKSLDLELKAAEELLNWGAGETFRVDNRITKAKDGHINFGGLNAWQPLGRVAAVGDKLIVYVGHNTKNIGERSDLKLYATQYHAEANRLSGYYSLKVGRNEITLQQISGNDFERGGQLYIAYEGNNPTDQYAVRINGGTKIPALNVYKKEGAERTAAIEAYVAELETYQAAIAEKHETLHKGSDNKNVQYDYDAANCFLNATDLMMDYMLYSLPATQVWNSLSGSSVAEKAASLDTALRAMDQTMTLFYQHKGLSAATSGYGGRNLMPSRHLNIRYMRMFSGAFMYASGDHIGVEYGSTGLCGASGWNSFGWGIAHEIGHDINDPNYAIAEITNNYFAQLLTSDYIGPRWGSDYRRVYEKVTSGTTGRSPNVGTQLALYWQLHLAFDDFADDKKIFADYEEQFDSLFFARVDTYSRNPGLAKKGDVELKLDGGVDQNLMRLACAAANANILSFFERWGMVPDEQTVQYAELCGAATEKALYYVNETARDYRVAHPGEDTGSCAAVVTATAEARSNQVAVQLNVDDAHRDQILGYEIWRGMKSRGELKGEVIGFIQAGDNGTESGTGDASAVYYDTISALDNRVMVYRVRAVDKFLNYSAETEAGSAKISTEGVLGKDLWIAETTMGAAYEADSQFAYGDDDPDGGYGEESGSMKAKTGVEKAIDGDWNNAFVGNFAESGSIIIDMQKTTGATSIRYKGSDVTISVAVSADGNSWTSVKDKFAVTGGTADPNTGFTTIWFDSVHEDLKDKWIGTYDARFVKLIMEAAADSETDLEGVQLTVNEIDVCGPSGDNVEFYADFYEGKAVPVIGVVKSDYQYGAEDADVIPAGSLLFAGNYKGNPAYNVVALFDQDGNVIGADDTINETNSVQVFLADVPEDGELGETYDGAWVYFILPGAWEDSNLIKNTTHVRAELFRVDNAQTLEGERIVSDTEYVEMPKELPSIELTNTIQQQ